MAAVDKKIVIVGTGTGGMAAAIAVKKQYPTANFTMYEKAWDVGGTWRENTYPGCACDIPSAWYSLSTDINPAWSQEYSGQPEILEYLRNVAKRRGLLEHIEFGSKLIDGIWDDEAKLYRLKIARLDKTGETTKVDDVIAHIMISAIGGLHIPEFPNIKGLDTFKGHLWHAAQWRHDVSLVGKRVGVIGNGCSGAQIVPTISEDPNVHVINFCRTPSWFAPRGQFKWSKTMLWVFANVPFVAAAYRFWTYAKSDVEFTVWRKERRLLRKFVTWLFTLYLKSQAPKHLWDKLIPKYEFGCKRIIRDPGYLKSLHRPNVEIIWDPIQEIVEDGIVLKDGSKQQLDVIVPATGFAAKSMTPPIKGLSETAAEYFARHGGATAYRGTTMPGFPNYFIVLGPNVATGHASVIYSEEVQVRYAMKMIKPILEGKLDSVTVKEEPTEKYNDTLQHKITNTVWDTCVSYYNQHGGRNIAMYPGTVTSYNFAMRKPIWKDYDVSYVKSANGEANGNGHAKTA